MRTLQYLYACQLIIRDRGRGLAPNNVTYEIQPIPELPPIVWVSRPNVLDLAVSTDLGFMAW